MAFDEDLADRIRKGVGRKKGIEESILFGCACFLLGGNVLVGVWKQSLIARVGPDEYEDALLEANTKDFDITGKPMKGWVAVGPEGVKDEEQVKAWIERAVKFVRKLPAKEK